MSTWSEADALERLADTARRHGQVLLVDLDSDTSFGDYRVELRVEGVSGRVLLLVHRELRDDGRWSVWGEALQVRPGLPVERLARAPKRIAADRAAILPRLERAMAVIAASVA